MQFRQLAQQRKSMQLQQQQQLQFQQQQQQQQQVQQQAREQEEITETNWLKMKLYLSFNNIKTNVFSNELIDRLTEDFNRKLDKLIRWVYLRLMLKEIHDSRKWNNLLVLNNNSNSSFKTSSGAENTSELKLGASKKKESLVCNCVWSVYFKLHRLHQTTLKTHSTNDSSLSLSLSQQSQQLQQQVNQQLQSQQSQQQQQQQQQQISQGLKKLQESLVNFKLEDYTPSNLNSSNLTTGGSGDLYVYTRKDEIYLLKLEECTSADLNSSNLNNNNSSIALTTATNYLTTSAATSNTNKFLQHYYHPLQTPLETHRAISVVSRRSSYACITPTTLATTANVATAALTPASGGGVLNSINVETPTISTTLNRSNSNAGTTTAAAAKTQNLSGGAGAAQQQQQQTPITLQQQQSQQQQRSVEYVRLSVYGLQEPCEEMKSDLCKSLQSDLDYWLLQRMCTSIEKNTYKTTSVQHPDRITDEDLTFFKHQICDMSFDYELEMPFLFNFNRTLRDNFFYFLKQILNASFKSIDAPMPIPMPMPMPHLNQFQQQQQQQQQQNGKDREENTGGENESEKEAFNDDASECSETESKSSNREVGLGGAVENQQSSTTAPSTGAATASSKKKTKLRIQAQAVTQNKTTLASAPVSAIAAASAMLQMNHDPYMIMLSRILFHNSKSIRIGKHSVSLVLVEAFYSIKGKSDTATVAKTANLQTLVKSTFFFSNRKNK